ncbi:MAG: tetratricopeptide repeat protein, partial [Deltaproteobacteria bacterium]|nr:tetratricopeptide repeat protein [Deltaproteobacteria bacterium]
MALSNKERLARKVKKIRKKSGQGNKVSPVFIIAVIVTIAAGVWLYMGFNPSEVRLNHIIITKNTENLKLLKGETARFHPSDLCKIDKISTNVLFNQGISLTSTGIDVNMLLYEAKTLEKLLADKDMLKRHQVTLEVKRGQHLAGTVEIVVEPDVSDWVARAEGAPDSRTRVDVLEKAVDTGFVDPKIIDMLVDEYIASKEWRKATDLIEKIAGDSPEQEDIRKLLKVYEAAKNNVKIADMLIRLIKLSPDELPLRFRLAELYENTGKRENAITEYRALLEKVPENDRPFIYKTLGYLYSESRQTKNAIDAYLKALELDPEDVNLYYNLSGLYERAGDKSNSDKYLSIAMEKKPDDIESRIRMAEGLIAKKDYKKAEEYLNEVIKVRPNYTDAWLMFANLEEKRGNKKALREHYKKILSLVPGNKTVLFNLGTLEYETGNPKNAKDYFLKYLTAVPGDIESREFLFEIYKKEKNDKSAYEQASKILDKNPGKKQYYSFVFDYLNRQKNFKTMHRIMDTGLKKNPGDTDI